MSARDIFIADFMGSHRSDSGVVECHLFTNVIFRKTDHLQSQLTRVGNGDAALALSKSPAPN